MDRGDYITKLFNDIKDNIEFDSDVIALTSLLNAMLEINVNKSFENWKYIINKYDIKKLSYDIDFNPLFNDYLINLFKRVGLKEFFIMLKNIRKDKKIIIYSSLFNIYNNKCFLYSYVEKLIKSNKILDEEYFINKILEESCYFPSEIFDKTTFLKNIILIHINTKKISLDFLNKITEYPHTLKDKAILKTLLIDYI